MSISISIKTSDYLFLKEEGVSVKLSNYRPISNLSLIQGGPEKNAQTLMRYNFSTAGHRVTRFPAKCSETNW